MAPPRKLIVNQGNVPKTVSPIGHFKMNVLYRLATLFIIFNIAIGLHSFRPLLVSVSFWLSLLLTNANFFCINWAYFFCITWACIVLALIARAVKVTRCSGYNVTPHNGNVIPINVKVYNSATFLSDLPLPIASFITLFIFLSPFSFSLSFSYDDHFFLFCFFLNLGNLLIHLKLSF